MVRQVAVAVLVVSVACKSSDPAPPSTCGTHGPVVSATATPTSVEPVTGTVQLSATSTDADDACLPATEGRSYRWSVESRPPASSAVISDPASPTPTLTPDVPGAYQLAVTATDAAGHASAPTFVTVSASACGTLAPSLSFTGGVAANIFNPVTLPAPDVSDANCLASGTVTYAWSIASRPAGSAATLSDATAQRPVLVPDVPGTYDLVLVVTSSLGIGSQPAHLRVSAAPCGAVQPVLPALSATPVAPDSGDLVTLGLAGPVQDANASTCALGTLPYSYRWKLVARPAGSETVLTSETAAAPSFLADVPGGVYQVALTVTDALGNASDPSFLSVKTSSCGAHQPIVSFPLAPFSGNANTLIPLAVVTSDADSTACPVRFAVAVSGVTWSVVGQPAGSHPALVSPSTLGATPNAFQADVPGTYTVEAVATAANGIQGPPARASVVVAACGSHAPVVSSVAVTDSGGALVSRPAVGQPVSLVATAFDADAACGAGSASAFAWTLTSAPAGSAVATPSSQPGASLAFTPDVAGTYVWSIVAVDPQGLASAPVSVTVPTGTCGPTITGAPIVASPASPAAGATVSLSLGGAVQDTCVAGGPAPTVRWSLTARPAGSSATLSDPSSAVPAFTADVPGTYCVELVVTDSGGFSSVFGAAVSAESCTPPAIDATRPFALYAAVDPDGTTTTPVIFGGGRVTLALPLASSTTGGLVPGTCGSAVSYEWSMISRPPGSQAQLSTASGAWPSFVADVPGGAYQVALLVRDAQGNASAPFFATLAASPCGTLPPFFPAATLAFSPTARANQAFQVTAPSAVDGNGSCPARFLATGFTYAFSVVSSPAGATARLSPAAAGSASLTVDRGGSYAVQAVATSSAGLVSAPLVSTVQVSNCGAFPPVATGFSLAQAVPVTAGQAVVSDAPAPGSSSSAGFYVGVPLSASAQVTDQDLGPGCAAFAIPPQVVSYAWSIVQAPPGSRAGLTGQATPAAVLTPDVPGLYTFSLTTTDSTGSSSATTVSLAVPCGASAPFVGSLSATQTAPGTGTLVTTQGAPPVALAVGYPVALALAAGDPDATATGTCTVPEAQPLAYQWSFTQLPPGSRSEVLGAGTAAPSFIPDVAGAYVLAVTVTDPQGHAASSQLPVSVTCDAAAPAVATVAGSPSTPDFTLTQVIAGIGVAGQGGTHTLVLTRGSDPATGLALLDGAPAGSPSAIPFYAGFPLQVAANVPAVQTSAGCGFYPQVLTYAWSFAAQPPGSAARLSGAAQRSPSFVPDLPGVYELQLDLTDQLGRKSSTLLALDAFGLEVGTVGVCGTRGPLVVARATAPNLAAPGGTALEPLGVRTLLDASGSQSPDGVPFALGGAGGCGLSRPLSYTWSLASAPPGSTAQLSSATLVDPAIVLDLPGRYALDVTVSDGARAARATVALDGVAGFTSTPAVTGAAFTATTVDGSGQPVVAWWDQTNGTVGAARCTASCDTASPTWTSLGTVDSGLGTAVSFASEDEPRPVAVAVSGGTTYVAYFTGTGAASTTGAHGVGTCNVAVAVHDGTGWVSWNAVAHPAGTGFASCTAGGAAPYANFEYGRWLSMAMAGPTPVVTFWSVVGPNATQLEYAQCTTPACTTMTNGVVDPAPLTSMLLGRWNAVAVDAAGAVNVAYYVADDGTGRKGLRFATNASGTFAPADIDASATVDVGRFASIAAIPAAPAGPSGAPAIAIAYRDATGKVAKLARCTETGSGCTFGTPAVVADAGGTDTGLDAALAADPTSGLLRLAYYDASQGVLRVLSSTDGTLFSPIAELATAPAPNAPLGVSIGPGGRTAVAFSRGGTGPIGFLSGP
jgi:hypothetical protein